MFHNIQHPGGKAGSRGTQREYVRLGRFTCALVGAGIVLSGFLLWSDSRPAKAQGVDPARTVLHIYSVGGVLTADGNLWQYHPQKKQWLTIDEAFRDQGRETRILPLPVKADEIAEMVTWGFLLTRGGDCWLYDIDTNRWDRVPPPAR